MLHSEAIVQISFGFSGVPQRHVCRLHDSPGVPSLAWNPERETERRGETLWNPCCPGARPTRQLAGILPHRPPPPVSRRPRQQGIPAPPALALPHRHAPWMVLLKKALQASQDATP